MRLGTNSLFKNTLNSDGNSLNETKILDLVLQDMSLMNLFTCMYRVQNELLLILPS